MADELDRALDAFRSALRMPLRQDAEAAEELALEASPVIEAFVFAIRAAGSDPAAMEHREGLAMAALLGRRAAIVCVSPSAALAVVEAIAVALGAIGCTLDARLLGSLRAVLVEGYCAAIEERVRDDAATRVANALTPSRIAPRCWAVIVGGEPAAESLRDALDRVCRPLLHADARACLLHIGITAEPSEDVAREVFSFDATARMIGVEVVFSGVDARWRAVAAPRLELGELTLVESFEDGLHRALEASGAQVQRVSPIVERMRGLFGVGARRS